MQYHIQTTPIWDAFRSGCDCPLCTIYKTINDRLVSQYLNESVMEPDSRVKVNKLGFCGKHLLELYAGENKLGLALQLGTRTETVVSSLKKTSDAKSAKKHSAALKDSLSTCIICKATDEMMERYAYTIAMMYLGETEFPELLRKSNGFCMPHYTLLLDNASKAGKLTKDYLNDLYIVQKSALERGIQATRRFTDMFDYRSTTKHFKGAEDIVPKAVNRLASEIIRKK